MLAIEQFTQGLNNLKGRPVESSYFRFVSYQYANAPLSSFGSKLSGGRYNYINTFEILYVAPDPHTALEESIPDPAFCFPPKVIFKIEVSLQHVLDLSNPDTVGTLGIDNTKLILPWFTKQNVDKVEAYTQTIGRLVYESKMFEGILYPSAQVSGKFNLAIFNDSLKPKSKLSVPSFEENLV